MQRVYRQCQIAPNAKDLALQETIFHNANGYIGVRGTLEEGLPEGMNTMRGISFCREEYRIGAGETTHFERILDMDRGITERHVTWCSPSGKVTEINVR